MIEGKRVYKDLDQSLRDQQTEVQRVGEHLQRAHSELERLRADESRQVGVLAKARLEELAADRILAGIDHADHRAMQILLDGRQAEAALLPQIEASQTRQGELADRHTQARAALDEAKATHATRLDQTMLRLVEQEDYAFQVERVKIATDQATHAGNKALQSENDRQLKRQPYENDRLFAYLWRRRYRFPEYHAWPLTRALDGWVAGLCRYENAHRDYRLLLEIPDRLRQHAEQVALHAQAEAHKLRAIEHEALQADGVDALSDQVMQRIKEFERVEADIEREEANHRSLLEQLNAFHAGTDTYSREALAVLTAQVESEDATTLRADARGTNTPRDDVAAAAIDELRKTQATIHDEIEQLRSRQQQSMQALEQLQRLRSRFRQEGFDSRESMFDSGFQIGDVLQALLTGAIGFGSAWSRINQQQRFRRHTQWDGTTSTTATTAIDIIGGVLDAIGSSRRRGGGGGFGGFGGFGGGGGGFGGGGGGGGGFGGGGFTTGGKF